MKDSFCMATFSQKRRATLEHIKSFVGEVSPLPIAVTSKLVLRLVDALFPEGDPKQHRDVSAGVLEDLVKKLGFLQTWSYCYGALDGMMLHEIDGNRSISTAELCNSVADLFEPNARLEESCESASVAYRRGKGRGTPFQTRRSTGDIVFLVTPVNSIDEISPMYWQLPLMS